MRTLVVIPTYNERENVGSAVARLLALGRADLAVLIVDDASPDGTGALADALAQTHPDQVSVLHRTGKLGLGSAYVQGFRAGLAAGAEIICEMDADGSHDPDALPALLAEIDRGADVVIGSRRVPGGSTRGWGAHRHLMSAGATAFARLALGLATKDVTSGFRCYRRPLVEALLKEEVASDGYAFQEETLFHCERLGARVREVPITFRDRIRGESKLSWSEVPAFFAAVVRLRRRFGRVTVK